MNPNPDSRPRLGARVLLFALLLTACDLFETTGEYPGSDANRSVKKGSYTDHELGYTLRIPKGWKAEPNARASYDVWASNTTGYLYARHSEYSYAGEMTLSEYVSYIHSWEAEEGDTTVILPARLRDGVEVIPVRETHTYSSGRLRYLDLYFLRGEHLVQVSLLDYELSPQTARDIARIDSSLAFF